MVLEDIKYQLDQFYGFDNIKLSFEVLNKQGYIYCTGGKILNAVWDQKRDIDVFKELSGVEAPINIQVGIGESAPEITLNRYFEEIIEIINGRHVETETDLNINNTNSEIVKKAGDFSPALVAKISESLSVIPGVESIIAIKENGEILYCKGVDDVDFESADAVFFYNQAKELGDILNFNSLKSVICEANNYKKIIINSKNILYGMKVSREAPALKTQMEAVKLLKDT
jgi:hypothetical protein